MITSRPVVVGVDGSDVARNALAFAADEARRRHVTLHVVYAAPAWPSGDEAEVVAPYAEVVLSEAAEYLAEVHPTLQRETLFREGDPADVLVGLSQRAGLLVVGTHRMGRLRGFVLGSVSQRVAARAACPVVTITGPPLTGGPIVVGCSTTAGGLAALQFACEEAALRGLPVRAIRAVTVEDWLLPGFGYPVAMDAAALQKAAENQLTTSVAKAQAEFPDLEISGELSNADAFVALHEATAYATMVVIGARRSRAADLPHLGPVAAWLLHQAQCPLVVVGRGANTAVG